MFCTNCGTQLSEGSAFCSNCGKAVASVPVNANANEPQNTVGSNEILLEGKCTFWFFPPGVTFANGADCKFQISSGFLKFLPGWNSFLDFGKKDIKEVLISSIVSINKTKYNLLFPALEVATADQCVYKFAGYGKINEAYSILCRLAKIN